MQRQKTLDKFVGIHDNSSSSDSSSLSNEQIVNEETKQEHWTGVKPRNQLASSHLRVYNIKDDLEALAEETSFKEMNTTKSNVYFFDTDIFDQNDANLVPENHAFTQVELQEQALIVCRLRTKFEEAGIVMLQQAAQDSKSAGELFNHTVKRLTRRKMALKERNKLLPRGKELQLHYKPGLCKRLTKRQLSAAVVEEI